MKRLLLIILFFTASSVYAVPQLDLALCLDSSGSINSGDFQLQLDGTASSIENPAIVPQDGSVRITVLQFGSSVSMEVPPTVIDASNAASVATTIRNIAKSGGGTNMSDCISAASTAITGAAPASTKRIIDLSTDGRPNSQPNTTNAAAAAQAAGVDALNALLVGPGVDPTFMGGLVFPQPNGGSNGFATLIPDFASYESAITTKIKTEIVPPNAIPTLSEWGLILLTFLLALVSWVGVGRKRQN